MTLTSVAKKPYLSTLEKNPFDSLSIAVYNYVYHDERRKMANDYTDRSVNYCPSDFFPVYARVIRKSRHYCFSHRHLSALALRHWASMLHPIEMQFLVNIDSTKLQIKSVFVSIIA